MLIGGLFLIGAFDGNEAEAEMLSSDTDGGC